VTENKPDRWIFGHPFSENREYFMVAVKRTNELLDLGYIVYCPNIAIYFLNTNEPRPYEFWLDYMLPLLYNYDGVILAPEWRESNECWWLFGHFLGQGKKYKYFENLVPQAGEKDG